MFVSSYSTVPKLQIAEDLQGDALLHYDAEMELMNLDLLSIPNEIYNSVDACTTAKEMWKRVERLMRGTIQNQVDRETRFTSEFDQFVAKPGEALVSVYNRFAQLMNDFERNKIIFPIVIVNTKFLNSLQLKWLKYVTQVRLAKRLTVDSFDDLFDYLQQFEKLQDDVQTNSEDPLASAMLLIARAITQNFSNPTNYHFRTSSNTKNQAIIQGDRVNIQSRNSAKSLGFKVFLEQMLLAKQDEAGVILTDENKDFLFADASRMEEIEELSANICLMARIQPDNNTFDAGPSYDSAFISEERVRVLENINGDNNYLNEFLEADRKAKHFNQQAQSQFIRDRDIIRDLEKQRDKLDLAVNDYKRKNEELQKTHLILKRQMSENEDRYHDNILDLEAKLKKNVDLMLKLGNSLQGMFMLGPKPLSVYDPQLKHGLGYSNPYTLKQAISQCPKLYLASSLSNSEIPLNVRDTEDTLDDASKSQQKMKEKMNDPIAVANKQNCWTIDYQQINALYKDFVPQKELSAEQKYFPSSFIPSDKTSNATSSIPTSMPSESPLIIQLDEMKIYFQTLSELIQKNCKKASIFYTYPEEIQLNDFCQDQVKPIVNELQFYFEFFRKLFQKDIKEMKDVIESTESELCEIKKQNDVLKDQLLEASLKHEVEIGVLLNHECEDNSLHAALEQVKKNSIEIQEGLQAKIKILEKDVQICQKQSVDFELKLQHAKEKHKWESTLNNKNTNPLDYSWISKMEKLENENVSLDFIETVEKGKSVNTKFDMTNVSQNLLCVTPLNKQVFQKKTVVSKTKEKDVVSKPVTLQTSPDKQRGANSNKNVIVPGMYRVVTTQESQTNEAKSDLSSTGMNAASNVRRPMNRDSHVKNSVLANSKNSAKNKQTNNTSANVISNKENVNDVNVKNAAKAKTLLCVSCMQNDVCQNTLNVLTMLNAPWPTCDQKFKAGIVNPDRSTHNIRAYPYKATIWIAYSLKALVSKSKASNVFKTHGSIYSRSSKKPSSSVKKWVVKLPTCPCVGSSYVVVALVDDSRKCSPWLVHLICADCVVPKLRSNALACKIYFYSNLRTPFIAQGALYKIKPKSSGKSSSSGNLGSGRDILTVGKISSSGNHITSSGNALAFYS
ncbi:hypothetical protein Tco_1079681 [Tanacetum coccineum]|uniref:Uncharacterized protein n=1 Tax=Tanacetum coccineum TaxID=301880 RepID=A0ABQ5HTN7_9ASTR